MPSLTLSEEEAKVLRQVLQTAHNTLLLEISHSDSLEFKEMLRRRETVIAGLLNRLA